MIPKRTRTLALRQVCACRSFCSQSLCNPCGIAMVRAVRLDEKETPPKWVFDDSQEDSNLGFAPSLYLSQFLLAKPLQSLRDCDGSVTK